MLHSGRRPRSFAPGEGGVSLRAIRERVLSSRPELESNGATLAAAVVLLAAKETGFNIDRLARVTRVPRGRVARMIRRLFDNGVLQGGEMVCCWGDAPELDSTFWSDVAVMEGQACRRVNEAGEVEWAPPGFWRKEYGFVCSESEVAAVVYRPAVPEGWSHRPRGGRTSLLPGRSGIAVGAARSVAFAPEVFPDAAWLT